MKTIAEINEILSSETMVAVTDRAIAFSTSVKGSKRQSHSAATRQAISAGNKKHVRTEEHKQAISLGKTGKPISEKLRAALVGRHLSEEHKAKLAAATSKAMTGRKFSEEHREAIAKARRGTKLSPVAIAKFQATMAWKRAEREATKAKLAATAMVLENAKTAAREKKTLAKKTVSKTVTKGDKR